MRRKRRKGEKTRRRKIKERWRRRKETGERVGRRGIGKIIKW